MHAAVQESVTREARQAGRSGTIQGKGYRERGTETSSGSCQMHVVDKERDREGLDCTAWQATEAASKPQEGEREHA